MEQLWLIAASLVAVSADNIPPIGVTELEYGTCDGKVIFHYGFETD